MGVPVKVGMRSLGFLLVFACSLSVNTVASAQVIEPEPDGAAPPTVDEYLEVAGLSLRSANANRFTVFGDLSTALVHSSNALSFSNLPGGLEQKAVSDTVWRKSASLGLAYRASSAVTLFASAELGHTNYFDNSFLNYYDINAIGGVHARITKGVSILAAANCVSQRDDGKFKQYYGYCGPVSALSLTTGDPQFGSGTRWSIHVRAPRGKAIDYARYVEVGGAFSLEAGRRVRFQIGPRGSARWYSTPDVIAGNLGNRRDYTASLRSALLFRSRRFEFGASVEPLVNWSNYAVYRFWDVRGGPFARWSF